LAKLRAIKIAQITARAAEAKTLPPDFGIRGRENYPPVINPHFVKIKSGTYRRNGHFRMIRIKAPSPLPPAVGIKPFDNNCPGLAAAAMKGKLCRRFPAAPSSKATHYAHCPLGRTSKQPTPAIAAKSTGGSSA